VLVFCLFRKRDVYMSSVNVYESEFCNDIVARVKYNEKTKLLEWTQLG